MTWEQFVTACLAVLALLGGLFAWLTGRQERRLQNALDAKADVTDVKLVTDTQSRLTRLFENHCASTLSADAWAMLQHDIEEIKRDQKNLLQRMSALEAVMRK